MHQQIGTAWESGVALRLPPQSKATLSMDVQQDADAQEGRGTEVRMQNVGGRAAEIWWKRVKNP
jgi:hypothetical protein